MNQTTFCLIGKLSIGVIHIGTTDCWVPNKDLMLKECFAVMSVWDMMVDAQPGVLESFPLSIQYWLLLQSFC